ncbi:MAG: phage holin family protein [Saprospiraceae bacterium]|nr:phage holin family protein [Saprospiraceae bacterium]
MFSNKKTLSDRLKEVLTDYIDSKFEDYRGHLANDLSKGLASLAGLVAIWSLAIVCLMFFSISIALLLGWAFTFWMSSFSYVFSFLIIAVLLLGISIYILKNIKKIIEDPVYKIMSISLNETQNQVSQNKEAIKKRKKTNEINSLLITEKTEEKD